MHRFFALFLLVAAGTASATPSLKPEPAAALLAAQAGLSPASPATSPLSDFDPDPAFGMPQPGMNWYSENSDTDSDEFAQRVFPNPNGGYWLVGTHLQGTTVSAYIAKLTDFGALDTSWGTSGKARVPLPFLATDVAKDPVGDTFFFVGPFTYPGFSDSDFGVFCVDAGGDDASACDFFGDGGFTAVAIDVNGEHNDVPERVVATVLGQLYIAGVSDTNSGSGTNWDVSVAEVSAITGNVTTSFGTNGHVTHGIDHVTNGSDFVNDIVVDENFTLPTYRIYVAGTTQHVAANDTDAYVMALNPATGAYDTSFAGSGVHEVYADLGTTNKQDIFTRVKVLRDHSVVAAGTSEDDGGDLEMLVAKFRPDGSFDTGFCGGPGHCIEPLLDNYVVTNGITEREGSGDLVFALDLDIDSGADHHAQAAIQYGRSGVVVHAFAEFDYAAFTGTTPASHANDALIDASGRFLIAGWRLWDAPSNDVDMTLVRTVPDDSIFASGLE